MNGNVMMLSANSSEQFIFFQTMQADIVDPSYEAYLGSSTWTFLIVDTAKRNSCIMYKKRKDISCQKQNDLIPVVW